MKNVQEEDKNLLQDILNVSKHLFKDSKSWIVNPNDDNYEIIVSFDTNIPTVEIFVEDLFTLKELDNWRISNISVRLNAKIPQIRIIVIPRSKRVIVQQTDIVRIQKKRRFFENSS